MQKHWEAMSDEALAVAAAKAENRAFTVLVARLLPRLRAMADGYHLPGLDRDDLVQEGFLGVMNAVRHYRAALGEFAPYALTCARNSMGSAARLALSGRNEPHRWMQSALTPYEQKVLRLFLAGYPYSEIASLLSSHSKAVDNALQRVRRKLRQFYSAHPVST